MAVGFWSKLVELAKKIWNGVKTGAEIATKYVMPIAKHTTSLLNKSDNKTVQIGGAPCLRALRIRSVCASFMRSWDFSSVCYIMFSGS